MTDSQKIEKNREDLKALQALTKSKGWKVLTEVVKDNRKWKTQSLILGIGQSEKEYSKDDLTKIQIKMYNWLIDAPELLIASIESEQKEIDPSDSQDLEIGDVDDLFNDQA